jgi:hypothetical protein
LKEFLAGEEIWLLRRRGISVSVLEAAGSSPRLSAKERAENAFAVGIRRIMRGTDHAHQ